LIKPTSSQTPSGTYDPWVDLNDDGAINILDAITLSNHFLETGTSINKTALLLELQSNIDNLNSSLLNLEAYFETRIATQDALIAELQSRTESLNSTIGELQDRLDMLSVRMNQTKTIRFYTPNETYANATQWFTAATFTWTPDNLTNSAILGGFVFFDSKFEQPQGPYTDAAYSVDIAGHIWSWSVHGSGHDYCANPIYELGPVDGIYPNGNSYTITVKTSAGYNNSWIKNIHVVLIVMDGLPY
jgi:uncharacterized coiled-coil protein SlyX